MVGKYYNLENWVDEDKDEAFKWIERSASQKNTEAECLLGFII